MDRESKNLVCSGPQPGPKRTEAGMAAWGVGAAAALIALLSACSWCAPYTVATVNESQTARCQYLGTAAAIADMGAPQVNPRFRCDAEHRVLRQAEMMTATHVVWLGNYPFAAAAAAYRCPDR